MITYKKNKYYGVWKTVTGEYCVFADGCPLPEPFISTGKEFFINDTDGGQTYEIVIIQPVYSRLYYKIKCFMTEVFNKIFPNKNSGIEIY